MKTRRPQLVSGLLLMLCLLLSCVRTIPSDLPDLRYYPIVQGKYRTYSVSDCTRTTAGFVPRVYYKRELTDSNSSDLNNRLLSRLHVERSQFDSLNLACDTTWSKTVGRPCFEMWTQYIWADQSYAERTEGNTRYLPLRFPFRSTKSWNGNAYNGRGQENYVYYRQDTSVTIRGRTYSNCVMVMQRRENASLLKDILTYEIYAPGIGKIKRYDRYKLYDLKGTGELDFSTDTYIYSEELIDHNY